MGNQAQKTTLDSWKEIATYFRRTEKTCRRWEKELGLPVHRLEDSPRARVFAYKDEVDAWVEKAGEPNAQKDISKIQGARGRKRRSIYGTAALGAILVLAGLWLGVFHKKNRLLSSTPIRSIAVLPFADLSPGKNHGHLAAGMTDALINALCDIPGLRVPARTSSFIFKGEKTPLPEIGRLLHADALIEGSIQVNNETIRVTVQLVNVADGYHLWSHKYDLKLDDIFVVQDEIARAVHQALEGDFLDE